MIPLNPNQVGTRIQTHGGVERIQAYVEIAYCDAAQVRTFAVANNSLPHLSPGDQIYLASGGQGAYRTVLKVEPIAGGSLMIFLEPGRVPEGSTSPSAAESE